MIRRLPRSTRTDTLFPYTTLFRCFVPLSFGCLVILGAADMFSVYIRQSLLQLHTPDEMRGRVGSVSQLTISASNELGDAESGFLAALMGPVAAVVMRLAARRVGTEGGSTCRSRWSAEH